MAYQQPVDADTTRMQQVVGALVALVQRGKPRRGWRYTATQLVQALVVLHGPAGVWASTRAVGRYLAGLGLQQQRAHGVRYWLADPAVVERLANTQHVDDTVDGTQNGTRDGTDARCQRCGQLSSGSPNRRCQGIAQCARMPQRTTLPVVQTVKRPAQPKPKPGLPSAAEAVATVEALLGLPPTSA